MGKASRRKRQKQERALTPEQIGEVLRIVRDDLVFLKSLNYGRPSRTEVRVASSILRRLLHEELLQSAWKLAGLEAEPTITALDLRTAVEDIDPRYIQYAYAGGASTQGARYSTNVMLKVPREEVEAEGQKAVLERIQPKLKAGTRRGFRLREFSDSPAVISGSASVSRVHVVRYVADKLGGVHWDPERGSWSGNSSSRDRLLDEQHLIVGRLPAALYEAISISQAIAEADDVTRLIERVKEVAPEHERAAEILSFRGGRIGKYADITFNSHGPADDPKTG